MPYPGRTGASTGVSLCVIIFPHVRAFKHQNPSSIASLKKLQVKIIQMQHATCNMQRQRQRQRQLHANASTNTGNWKRQKRQAPSIKANAKSKKQQAASNTVQQRSCAAEQQQQWVGAGVVPVTVTQ